ncbi:MAG: hypothetical protein GX051_08405 [Clostridiales bacterium]|nr:hypothetical protein [Clostridiales bacterium]
MNDPLIGAVVDRIPSKPYRKLKPYISYLPPLIGAFTALMFMNVPLDENGKIVYILVLYFVWDLFYSFQDVGLWGMVALSSPRSDERTRIAQWASIGAGAGGAIAGTFQMVRSILTDPKGIGMADTSVFLLFGLVFGLGGELLSLTATKMPEIVQGGDPEDSVFKSLAILRHNPTLLLLSLARFMQSVCPKVQNAYFFENCVSFMNGQQAEFLFGFLSGVPGAFAVFFTTKIVKKIGGMKKLLLLSQIMLIGIRTIVYFVGYDSPARFVAMIVLFGLINIPGSLMDTAYRSLTSDSVDEVELKTGVRSEGVCFAMQNFTTKMQSGATSLIEGYILKLLKYNSVDKAAGIAQNATFLKWQWPMFVLGPIIGAVFYMIIIAFIKDSDEYRNDIERQLRQRREALGAGQAPVEPVLVQ